MCILNIPSIYPSIVRCTSHLTRSICSRNHEKRMERMIELEETSDSADPLRKISIRSA